LPATPTLDAIQRECAAFEDSYRLGYAAGYEVGHGAAVHEIFARAEWLAGQQAGNGPSRLELLRRRCENHPAGCTCQDCHRYATAAANPAGVQMTGAML